MFYLAPAQDTPLAFPVATAPAVAQQFVQQSFGMPSDAVLTSTLEQWQVTPCARSAVPVGYEFIWTHADGMIGGDAIKVTVDDWRTFLAWIFTLGGKERVAVDAATGKILGAVSYW